MKRIILITLLALLVPVIVVEAHAELVKAVPEPGSVVEADLKEIRITFDEAIEEGSSITLYAEGFQAVSGIQAQLDGADMFATLPSPLEPGQYTVQWAAVGDDGHTTQGSYQFSVTAASGGTWLWWLLVIPVAAGGYAIWRRYRPTEA